jgi:ribose-phosphate pyrophosphokinase
VKPVVFTLPGNEAIGHALTEDLSGERGELVVRRFPDRETYVRVLSAVEGRDTVLVCSLDRPDDKLVALYLLTSTLRERGARRIVLVVPYLAYMRQDCAFNDGEAVSAKHVARWVSGFIDGLVTVDPHLHRIHDLCEIYRVPCATLHAAPLLAAWVREHVAKPLLVGPDSESRQWVADVARDAACPYVVLEKTRYGDRDVEIAIPDLQAYRDRTPVLVDDVISSGRTLIAATVKLRAAGLAPPVCVAVHAVFAGDAYEALRKAGAAQIVTTDAIAHPSNGIALHTLLAPALRQLLANLPAAAPREFNKLP